MRTTKLVLALLAGVSMTTTAAYAQMNKHDKSIAAYDYNIAVSEDDRPASGMGLNEELDKGIISEDGVRVGSAVEQQGQALPVATQAIQVGATAPDFSLPKTSGGTIALKDILAKGPAVVLFTRGTFCTFCVTQMQLLQKNTPQFAALGINVVAVSPEPIDSLQKAQQRFGLNYTLLSDYGSQAISAYGLNTPTGVVPSLVSIDATGKVVDVQTQQPGVGVFNLTQATNPLRGITPQAEASQTTAPQAIAPAAGTENPKAPAKAAAPATQQQVAPQAQTAPQAQAPAGAMPPVPSPQAGKVKYDVPPSNPDFGKSAAKSDSGFAV